MADTFDYDVFLSHSSKDKPVVRPLTDRLRKDGLRVWFDEWEISLSPRERAGVRAAKLDDGLERSRVLVLCMSANAFGSDWANLEAGTFRFGDPLNKDRRFFPPRLDDSLINGSLAQLLYINRLRPNREREYSKLLEACWASAKPPAALETTCVRLERSAAARGSLSKRECGAALETVATDLTRTLTFMSRPGEKGILRP